MVTFQVYLSILIPPTLRVLASQTGIEMGGDGLLNIPPIAKQVFPIPCVILRGEEFKIMKDLDLDLQIFL